jgi:hypothetical protein
MNGFKCCQWLSVQVKISAFKVLIAWNQVAIVNDEPVGQPLRRLGSRDIDTRASIEL